VLVNGPESVFVIQLANMKIANFETPSSVSLAYSATTDRLDIGQEIEWDAQHLALSAWTEHVPFAFWIIKALRPDCLVELGTERGVSYAAFCQAIERLGLGARSFAVDTWQGDEHSGHYDESVYLGVADLNERRYRRFSTLLRSTFAAALPYFADGEVDLLHIDGLHTYEAVAQDFATWRPKLSGRAVVLFHDTNVRRDEFGVWQLWRELAAQFPHFEFVHGYGLGVLGIGKDLPPPIQALFETAADSHAQSAVRGLFAARGAAVLRTYQLQSALEQAAAMAADAAGHRAEAEALRHRLAVQEQESASWKADAVSLRQQTEAGAATVTSLQQQLASIKQELQSSHAGAAALQEQLNDSYNEAAELRARLATSTREIADLNQQLVQAHENLLRQTASYPGLAGRIDELTVQLAEAEARCAAYVSSTSWRVTAPLRLVRTAVSKRRATSRLPAPPVEQPIAARPERIVPSAEQLRLLQPRVLIVGELSLPQCKKYRVDQKHDMIKALGWDCTIVAWQDTDRVLSLLQSHSVVIFYRVPAFDSVLLCMQEAHDLGLPHYFELDDLIFDLDDYAANPNLIGLDRPTAKALFDGATLYRRALQRCRNVIASTPYLAERMQAAGGGSSACVENALDSETLRVAAEVQSRPEDGRVRILYGSGTRTHDADFAFIAPALLRVAEENPNVDIVLVGELTPPKSLLDLGRQLQQLPACPYPEYLGLLAQSDIAIAPLFPATFNEAKSNIKFLEAASVGVPAVCSPRSAFARAIRPRETGFLAETPDEWYDALTALVADKDLRLRIGSAAQRDVLDRYSPDAVATRELRPVLAVHQPPQDRRLHVLQVNILFSPQSFGGATVVMEEVTRLLARDSATRVSVFASAPAGWLKPYAVERSEDNGVPVFRIGIQDRPGWMQEAWDEPAAEAFREVLRALRPDVVHFHAIQGIGAACLAMCQEENIPVVVTLHDAWWLCERQFLVTGEGKYCGQQQINLNVCATCVPDLGATVIRNLRLRQALEIADVLLAPSQHWRRFYLANGFAPDRVIVNENGIKLPGDTKPNEGPARLRFGFVAGAEPVKGFPLLKRAFESLQRDDWELVLVNHGLSIGVDSYADVTWQARGTIRTVPPFDDAGRDDFYASIDVLLFPSQWPESFGLTVREALARNKWVIATDKGGAAEAVSAGVNGTLIPITEDVAPLRKAVEDLLDGKPALAGWINPSSDGIRDFEAQAKELRGILASVASGAAVRPRAA
jgi:glycosyltransferase involved in cell wall biosynthesis